MQGIWKHDCENSQKLGDPVLDPFTNGCQTLCRCKSSNLQRPGVFDRLKIDFRVIMARFLHDVGLIWACGADESNCPFGSRVPGEPKMIEAEVHGAWCSGGAQANLILFESDSQ